MERYPPTANSLLPLVTAISSCQLATGSDQMQASAVQGACTVGTFQEHNGERIVEGVLQAIIGARLPPEELCSQ